MLDKEEILLDGATVAFYKYTIDDQTYLEFNTADKASPEPMINAMHGLRYAKEHNMKLVMINMQEPEGLYPRIALEYSWEVEYLDNDEVKIVFTPIGQ